VHAFGALFDFAEKTFAHTDAARGIVLPKALGLARGAHRDPDVMSIHEFNFHERNPFDRRDISIV
jgi:hypothetical protein